MARVLLLILLVWILYVVIKRVIRTLKDSEKNIHSNEKPVEKPLEKIVQCARCGLHVPESESQLSNNLIICNNRECQQLSKHD